MIETLDAFDKQLMLTLNFDGGAFLDTFWYAFSDRMTWIPLYVVILVALFMQKHHWSELLLNIIVIAVIITLCDQISSGLIKNLVCRPRPSHTEDIMGMLHYVNNYKAGMYGFVSSHAANTCGLTVFIFYLFREKGLRLCFVIWTLMTCYSRIYLGVHYPGDIMGGLLVGLFCGCIVMECRKHILCRLQTVYYFDEANAARSHSAKLICAFMIAEVFALLIIAAL